MYVHAGFQPILPVYYTFYRSRSKSETRKETYIFQKKTFAKKNVLIVENTLKDSSVYLA